METTDLDAPLLHALAASSANAGWHMPGHLSGRGFTDYFRQMALQFDTTELPSTDDINQPAGPALAAMQKAADAFLAGVTRFITCGSTCAIHILLAAAAGRKGSLLIPRASHQSVLYAASLLDLEVLFLESDTVRHTEEAYSGTADALPASHAPAPYLFQPVSAVSVEQALKKHPQCKTVLITSPDYYGQCCDTALIARICHQHNACLLVDEAHGAHFPFSKITRPYSAMASGADACVQSGHKTLPVLTQGAYLHLSREGIASGRISDERVAALIPVYQTSSPSFLIAASLDYARALMALKGESLISRQISLLSTFIGKMSPRFSFSVKTISPHQQASEAWHLENDPLRIVITAGHHAKTLHAGTVKQRLAKTGTHIEFADLTRLVLIPSLFHNESDWERLADGFKNLFSAGSVTASRDRQLSLLDAEHKWQQCLRVLPESVMKPGDALFRQHPCERKTLKRAEGLVSAQALIPYPPGVPLVWPGEQIEKRHLDLIGQLLENGISITGVQDGFVNAIKV